jgi:uncharacterized membrane protein
VHQEYGGHCHSLAVGAQIRNGPADDPSHLQVAAALAQDGGMDLRTVGRWLLAGFLLVAGISHFVAAADFLAQVPSWLPWPEAAVAISGVVELALGAALLLRPGPAVGWLTAAFFLAIFPGNVAQFLEGTDGFGLDTDLARGLRLLFQPVLIAWALWCTGAWRAWRVRQTGLDSG